MNSKSPNNNHATLTDEDILGIVEGTLPKSREQPVREALASAPKLVEQIKAMQADRAVLNDQPKQLHPPQSQVAAALKAANPSARTQATLPVAKITGSTVEKPQRNIRLMVSSGLGIAAAVALTVTLVLTGAQSANQQSQSTNFAERDYKIIARNTDKALDDADKQIAVQQHIDRQLFGDDPTTRDLPKLSPDRSWRRSDLVGIEGYLTTQEVYELAAADRIIVHVPQPLFAQLQEEASLAAVANWQSARSSDQLLVSSFGLTGNLPTDITQIAIAIESLSVRAAKLDQLITFSIIPASQEQDQPPVNREDLFWWNKPAAQWTSREATIQVQPTELQPAQSPASEQ